MPPTTSKPYATLDIVIVALAILSIVITLAMIGSYDDSSDQRTHNFMDW